jgi:hypothetical protein
VTRPAISPDQLKQTLDLRIQQAAEKAVTLAAGSHLNTAVDEAVKSIETFSQASIRQVEQSLAQFQKKLLASAREDLRTSLVEAQETAQRLEKGAAETHLILAESLDFLQEAARGLQNEFATRLRESAEQISAELGGTFEASLNSYSEQVRADSETRQRNAADELARSQEQQLEQFSARLRENADQTCGEVRDKFETSLNSYGEQVCADSEARQRNAIEELAASREQQVEQFRQQLETIVNSVLAALTAANDQSRALLSSLTQNMTQQLREASGGPAAH